MKNNNSTYFVSLCDELSLVNIARRNIGGFKNDDNNLSYPYSFKEIDSVLKHKTKK
ncbi:MAG: hypothetical protein IPJ20_25700 [Flammeovirgaceae bacterium]|nr:hypothetical protein [Flammeovirgaceae bacterium]